MGIKMDVQNDIKGRNGIDHHHHYHNSNGKSHVDDNEGGYNKHGGKNKKQHLWSCVSIPPLMSSTRLIVLVILCLQNSMFTVLRRYSQGVLKETYSKHEVLLFGEMVKMIFSAYMISTMLHQNPPPSSQQTSTDLQNQSSSSETTTTTNNNNNKKTQVETLSQRLHYLICKSSKMLFLAVLYGFMNILSFVALRNIGAGTFTIFAQLKILTTASCSSMMLGRRYSMARWRALISLMLGVLLFSEPIWNGDDDGEDEEEKKGNAILGTMAVCTEVTLSGFASIYFEKVIKNDPEKMNIWERNFQLSLGSVPIYLGFILGDGGGTAGFGGGWSFVAFLLGMLGAAGGLLVALSIKYGDSILKTLATTGAIIMSSLLDHWLLGGPLTPIMVIAGAQVIVAICDYTFDKTPTVTTTSNGNNGENAASTSSSSPSSRETESLINAEEGLRKKSAS